MKENLRRIILFTIIVVTGSVMILFDVPLIVMIPLIMAVGFVILVLLGAITVSEIRTIVARLKVKNFKKTGIIKRLDEMKFFEKTPSQKNTKPVLPVKKEEPGKPTAVSHIQSFVSSLGSLRTILNERNRRERKVEHINELLDKAVSEKVKGSALESAGNGVSTKIPAPPGASGPAPQEQVPSQDPFLSLSGDEFDVSLLDGLDNEDSPQQKPAPSQEPSPFGPGSGPDMAITDSDIPVPSLDSSPEAGDILKGDEGGLEEFKGLEGGDSIDQDFGDLDNLNLDDIDLDIDMEEETPATAGNSSAEEIPGSSPSPDPSPAPRTDWIESDAPKDADKSGNQISRQAEMASFAGGASGSDEDMLSSLASDVKHVKKELNISLLRDLKDFKAPATDIENELKEVYENIMAAPNPKKKGILPKKGLK
jgi:hypothetical protein